VRREDVAKDILASRARHLPEQRGDRQAEPVLDKIVEGRMSKFYAETCLLEQPFVKDPEHTVRDLHRRPQSRRSAKYPGAAFRAHSKSGINGSSPMACASIRRKVQAREAVWPSQGRMRTSHTAESGSRSLESAEDR